MAEQEPPSAAQRPDVASGAGGPAPGEAQPMPADPPTAPDGSIAQLPQGAAPAGAAVPPPVVPPPVVPPPVVIWEQPSTAKAPLPTGGVGALTVGGVVSDTFARYGADPLRIFALGLVPAIVTIAGALAIGTNPPTLSELGGYLFKTLVLSLGGGILGLISTAATFALLDGGRSGALGAAVRIGVSRSGWLLLAAILVGLGVGAVVLVIGLVALILFQALGGLAVLIGGVGVLIAVWISLRLTLTLPAVVVDRLGPEQAIKFSWAISRPAGVWLRIFGSLFVIGLLVGPASFLSSALTLTGTVPPIVATLIGGLLLAFLTPLSTVLQHAIYRRLVAPAQPLAAPPAQWPVVGAAPAPASLAASPEAPMDGSPLPEPPDLPPQGWAEPPAPASAVRPAWVAPPLGTRGRAIIGASIVLGVVGLVSAPLAIGALFSKGFGQLGFPNQLVGNVTAGTVAFGSIGNLQTCTVYGQTTIAQPYTDVVFMGHFRRPATLADEVRVQILQDGAEIVNEVEPRGSFVCLGIDQPEQDLGSGTYDFRMYLNDELTAEGTLVVQ